MRIFALATAAALGVAAPAMALDLAVDNLRGSGDEETVPRPAAEDWEAMATLDLAEPPLVDADDQLDVIMEEDAIDLAPVASADGMKAVEDEAPATVQEAMMALAPPEPAIETIPVLHASPASERVLYEIPRASTSLSVIGGGWNLNNPRGSTVTLGAEWAR